MKIKLKEFSLAYPVIKQIFDSITDFNRAWDLLPAFKNAKEAYELYHDKRDSIIISINPSGSISQEQAKEFEEKMASLYISEVDIDIKLKFYKQEVAAANIKNSELIHITHFIASE